MKRLTAILVAGLFVLAPLSASAMEMMSDSNMKDVTGQAGVSIAVDDIMLFQHIGYTKYTDMDGVGTTDLGSTDGPASVLLTDQTSMQAINAIAPMDSTLVSQAVASTTYTDRIGDVKANFWYQEDGIYETSGGTTLADFSSINTSGAYNWEPSPLTIDVGAATLVGLASMDQGSALTDVQTELGGYAGVIIGLPTVEINTSSDVYDVGVVRTGTDLDPDGDNSYSNAFIRIENGQSTTAILGGKVEIAPH